MYAYVKEKKLYDAVGSKKDKQRTTTKKQKQKKCFPVSSVCYLFFVSNRDEEEEDMGYS